MSTFVQTTVSTTLSENEPLIIAELQSENQRLTDSLQRCHTLVARYRHALEEGGEASFLITPKRTKRS
jgi:prephenate dehydrogenase